MPFEFTVPALRTSVEHQMDPDFTLQERLVELEKLDEQRQRALWEQEIAQRRAKAHHEKGIKPKEIKEGDLVLWYPKKIDGKRKNLTIGWTGPFEAFRIYENGSVLLKDLEGLELPERVNIGKLKKYWVRSQIQETARS